MYRSLLIRLFALAMLLGACTCSQTDRAANNGGTATTTASGGTAATGGSTSSGSSTSGGGSTSTGGSTSSTSTTSTTEPVDYCSACAAGSPSSAGDLSLAVIDEASGLAASQKHPGVYWVHNDSGDVPRFFGIDNSGADLGTYSVGNAKAVDWEDMALGPCPQGSCLLLGDIGDNKEKRSSYVIYRVPEPAQTGPGEHQVTAESLPFTYPDGSHNAETLLAHPDSGALFIVTKDSGGAGLYRFPMPLTPGQSVVLEKLGDLKPPSGSALFTAGDIHPLAAGILLRSYTHIWLYSLQGAVADALATQPCSVPAGFETQGETVAWTKLGDGYLTVSEGAHKAVNAVSCAGP